MDNCGSCKHYVFKAVSGPSCSLTGKAVSALMQKDCFVPNTDGPDVVTKVCNRCHRILPVSEFNRKASTKDGYQFQCKECQAEMARQLYLRRKEEQATAPKPEPETKVCRKCGRELPVTMFGYAPQNHNGLKSYCRDCENANCRKYRAERKAARQRLKDQQVVTPKQDAPAVPEEMTLEQAIDILVSKGFTITISKHQSK